MINLLPPKEKQALFSEQVSKLSIILQSTVLICLICLVFILMSVYFFISGQEIFQRFYFQQTKNQYQSPSSAKFKDAIQKYNATMPQIFSFYQKEKYFSSALNTIYAVGEPQGLSLLNFSLSDNGPVISVSVSGTSATRDDLVAFENNLEKNPEIKNVSFSPESWLNPANINFNVKFDLIP